MVSLRCQDCGRIVDVTQEQYDEQLNKSREAGLNGLECHECGGRFEIYNRPDDTYEQSSDDDYEDEDEQDEDEDEDNREGSEEDEEVIKLLNSQQQIPKIEQQDIKELSELPKPYKKFNPDAKTKFD